MDYAKSNLPVGHVTQIMHDRTIFLLPEPGLDEVFVELPSDLPLVFSQLSSALIHWHLQYRVIELLP